MLVDEDERKNVAGEAHENPRFRPGTVGVWAREDTKLTSEEVEEEGETKVPTHCQHQWRSQQRWSGCLGEVWPQRPAQSQRLTDRL
jgi:hypothetical protein